MPTTYYPGGLLLADLNRDGAVDAIVPGTSVDSHGGEFGVFLNDETGNWSGPFIYQLGNSQPLVAVADFNGDGYPDLLAAGDASPSVTLYLNLGDGTFTQPISFDAHGTVDQLSIADVNGDSRPDVVATASAAGLAVLTNLGDGGLGAPTVLLPATSSNPIVKSFALDANHDGAIDMLALRNTEIDLLLALGDGGFSKQVTTLGTAPVDALVGDFNGDDLQDVAVIYPPGTVSSASAIDVFLGSAAGTFSNSDRLAYCGEIVSPSAIDINADGKLDLIFGFSHNADVGVLLGNGDGTFGPNMVASPSNIYLKSYAIGDLNGDGKLDVVTTDFSDPQINVLLRL